MSFTFRDFGRRRRAGERVCAVFAGREKFNDNARVATGEVGPLNQYGGGVPGAPNGGRRRRRACAVHIFRGGARRAAPLWRGGRRRTPPPSSCLRVSTARKPGDLRERSHRRQRTADHDAHTTAVVIVTAVVVAVVVVKVVSAAAVTRIIHRTRRIGFVIFPKIFFRPNPLAGSETRSQDVRWTPSSSFDFFFFWRDFLYPFSFPTIM